MNEEEEAVQKTRLSFEDLCRALNMDEEASNGAWRSYENISKNYTLEGSELHWLACALYVACRTSVPTVGKGTAEGNYVSLTRILRSSEQSLIEFFSKMQKWQDMANLPKEFRQSTEKLERNFTVTAVIFKKYVPIFRDIFKPPSDEPPRTHRSRKQKRHPCTVAELFQFCWVLFVHAKGNFPMISDDLVNSYHLLLCALDLVYSNSLLCSSRKDLLNPNFKGLSEDFSSKDYKPGSSSLCFIEQLCELHHGVVLDAKGVKEHFWKPFIKKLFERKILKGKEETLTGFLDPVHFGDSLASLNRAYEEHVLSSGALDERIFLGDGNKEDIGTPGLYLCEGTENQDRPPSILHKSLTASALKVSTPLTGRTYLQDSAFGTPVSTAMEGIARLHSLLSGLKHRPSLRLRDMLKACARNPSEAIASRLREMSEVFLQSYEAKGEENRGLARDIAVKYFCLAEALYYKTLEGIIDQEKRRLGDNDLSCILEQDMFHRSLIACCLEIVIFSYHPPGEFQWVLQTFDIPPYHFYKVIEVLVRAEEGLVREVVKHLNHVEEQVLESLAWKESSPLWESIKGAKNHVPSCQEVIPPQYLEDGSGNLHTPKTNEISANTAGSGKGVASSSTTLHERYSTPPTGTARRRLFVDSEMTSDPPASTRVSQPSLVSTIPPGQTVVTMATATVTANNGQTVTIPVQGIANENGGITFIPVQVSMTGQSGPGLQPLTAQALTGSLNTQQLTTTMPAGNAHTSPTASKQAKMSPQQGTPNRVQRTGSLCLFFRKVYHLASVRLRDLCVKLDISTDLRRKIWTCFEYSLVHCTELMMNRHLDQLLMCAIYVIAKVTKEDKSFQNIMKCYRSQPQASSSVYRTVLISGRKTDHSGNSDNNRQNSPSDGGPKQAATSGNSSPVSMRSSSTLPVPQPSSASSTPTRTPGILPEQEEEEEQGDLICFYNQVYIKQIKLFALRYSSSSPKAGVETPPLCPYPSLRIGSPRRVLLSHNHSIYISPHKSDSPLTPRDKIFYYVSSSPSNRLREINSMLRTGETPTKKRSMALEEEQQSPAKRLCQENHSAFFRRLQDVANDRNNSH
ncbi:retinoblastoma-like protein 2 isoform X1 [Tachysurus fulvidraco]|uniref:retinoblastoma-like protein 2 isoform X1 n=2 Tax=Tachysurus fulvidraco TaxID=1234273 RepID=UPI001FEF8A1E|nr:retinoblastoma-like protein 2 isoform X1 [Tachysurus fulvidraco]